MMHKSVFATSINDLMQRNKFFQCFVCLQQFNRTHNFPMEICDRQHFMCNQCVQSNMFKKNLQGNGFACNLCSLNVDKTKIRRSPFLLSIKEFVEELVNREKVRKEKYKECMQKQAQFAEELMSENMLKTERIEQLENQLLLQEQMLKGMLEQNFNESLNINEKIVEEKTPPKHLLVSKIGLNFEEEEIKKEKLPQSFRSMFREIELMKTQIEETEEIDKEEYRRKIDELQKHQSYLYEILGKEENR